MSLSYKRIADSNVEYTNHKKARDVVTGEEAQSVLHKQVFDFQEQQPKLPSEIEGPWVMEYPTLMTESFSREGKWMLYFENKYMDAAWKKAVCAFKETRLAGVHSMKASTLNFRNPRASNHTKGVVIMYCGGDQITVESIGRNIIDVMNIVALYAGCTTKVMNRHMKGRPRLGPKKTGCTRSLVETQSVKCHHLR